SATVVRRSTKLNPRRKDSAGLDVWAEKLVMQKVITPEERDDFIRKNNSKELELKKRNLPQLRHYGFFTSIEAIRTAIHPKPDECFIIRCKSRENGEIKRLLDATLDEACAFGNELPGGFSAWIVEMKEFVTTIAAGTIEIAPSGATTIEMWRGGHYRNVTTCPKFRGRYDAEEFTDPTTSRRHFVWTAPTRTIGLATMRSYAFQALRYFAPTLKPKPHNQVYVEYGVRKDGRVYFIEANDSVVLTGRDPGPSPYET
ncbi:MAG TPA: hypothetical protein VF438_02025, partial [Candidatus Paceibacterota bacterium]